MQNENRHLRVQHYALGGGDRTVLGALARRVLDHVAAVCPACRRPWEALGEEGQARVLRELTAETARPPRRDTPTALLDTSPARRHHLHRALERLRYRRRRAQKQLSELRNLSPAERRRRVADARSRFRSHLLAGMLIDESRRRVRNEPAEAESFAALVPLVLQRPTAPDPATAPLLARAAAWRANALRVLGDLPAAHRTFVQVRHTLAHHRVKDPTVLAEAASLEASLRIAQRRFPEAEELLDRALLFHTAAHDDQGCCRALIQQGTLLQTMGRPAEAYDRLAGAAARLTADDPPYLHVCAVTARVNALCDLERYGEAEALLEDNDETFLRDEDPHTGAALRGLEGRVALGMAEYGRSARAFEDCRDAFLVLDRDYDALLAGLYLAQVYLEAGRNSELQELTRGLLSQFRRRGVPREALAALRLLARSVARDELTLQILRRLRHRLEDLRLQHPAAS